MIGKDDIYLSRLKNPDNALWECVFPKGKRTCILENSIGGSIKDKIAVVVDVETTVKFVGGFEVTG